MPPPRLRGDANMVGLLGVADDLALLLAFVHDGEGTGVSRALGLGPDDTAQFLDRGLTLCPEHRAV